MKIVVTGAAGFLGFHLSRLFLSEGAHVVGIDNMLSGQERNVQDLQNHKNFRFLKEDIIDLKEGTERASRLLTEVAGAERIYHMACPASPPVYQKDPLHTLDTCYLGSKNILDLAKRLKARILLASTSETYGDPDVHPQPESYRGNVNTMGPRSCYDEGKRIMETLGYVYSLQGVEVRVARIFNTYGPRMSPFDGRVITNFIVQALRGEDLTVFGSGKQTRSFCFYADLIRGLRLLMESPVTAPVNLGSQYEMTIEELANAVRGILDPSLKLKFMPLPQDDPKQRRPDTTLAFQKLRWKPEIDVATGLREVIDDMRSLKSEKIF